MKVYTKEELAKMKSWKLSDILNGMGTSRRYLSGSEWQWPHRDRIDYEGDDDMLFDGCLAAVNLSDPTVRETLANLLAASYKPGELPEASTIIVDIEGGNMVAHLSINVYTLDSYKEKCRQYVESTRVELLNKLSHLDEKMAELSGKVIGEFESFAAECEVNTDTSTETI